MNGMKKNRIRLCGTIAALLSALLLAGCAAPGEDKRETSDPIPAADVTEDVGETGEEQPDEAKDAEAEEEEEEEETEAEDVKKTDLPAVLVDGSGREYSANTLIVHFGGDVGEEAARAEAEKHGTEVVYFYGSFSSMAVKTARNLSADEMDRLAAAFEEDEIVAGTAFDYITRLDDPIRPGEVMG